MQVIGDNAKPDTKHDKILKTFKFSLKILVKFSSWNFALKTNAEVSNEVSKARLRAHKKRVFFAAGD